MKGSKMTFNKGRGLILALAVILGTGLLALSTLSAIADSLAENFEAFSVGSPNGQGGWSSTGSAGTTCGGASFDHTIVENTYGYATFGQRSLRISNAVTCGSFGDQTFSNLLVDEAGETNAYAASPSGTRQQYFVAQWDFASTVPGAEQPGLSVVASPDAGDGGRMSWVQMTDKPTGLEVNFFDYQDVAPFGSTTTPSDGRGTGDSFVPTMLASGLDRTVPHTIKIEVITPDGPGNDVVKIYVNGTLRHTGTTWEDYFRWMQGPGQPEQTAPVFESRTMRSILFRTSGTAVPSTLGNGFLIDNFSISSGPVVQCTTDCYVDAVNGNDALGGTNPATDAKKTIQAAINQVSAGGVVHVAAGTYTENLTINKSLTLNGAQAATPVSGRTKGGANESTVVGEISLANVSDVNIDGFTLKNPGGLRLLYLNATNDTTPVSNVKIANNFVTEVGSATSCDNIHVIFLNRGPDNVTIEGNHLSNLRSARSISAISLLDSVSTNPSENVMIRNNVFDDIASVAANCGANPSPRGAYGIISNNGTGSPNFRVLGNTFSSISGAWTHAVGLEGPTPNAVVLDNTFDNLTATGLDKSAVFFEKNPDGASVGVLFNQFNGNNFFGVAIHPNDLPSGSNGLNYTVDARHNWWGNASGPGDAGLGTVDPVTGAPANGSGAYVGTNVRFDEWLRPNPATVAYDILAASTLLNGPNSSTATNNGPGSYFVALSQFSGNPSNVANFSGAGTFFDVYVNGATATDSLTVVLPAVGNKALYYYNGTTWLPVMVGGNKVFPSGGTYTFVLSSTSEPKLTDLNGTPFAGAGNEEIRITPPITTTVSAGQTFQVVVDAGSDALFGVDVRMTFSAAELEVTSIALGNGLQPGTIAINTYDNGAGTLQFAYSQLGSSENNVSGTNVTLATITFLATDAGNPSVALGTVLFTDRDGNPTVPAPLDSPINLTVNPSPSVYVDVALQGRSDHAGLELQVSPIGPGNVLYDNTVVAGKLEIPTVPSGTYEARVSAPKYLAAVQTFTVSTQSVYDLNAPGGTPASSLILALRGGDINGDDQINIQDLVLIGVNFGSTTVLTSDINGDGVVNIQDLAIAAGNFGLKTGVDDYAGYPNNLWD
ncbi:hypothetical protein GC175_22110 [bacterium]|nr:hypothetical protein [bacterium]